MKWNRFTIKTKTEAEDVIISALADVGVEGVEIQDKQPLTETDKEQMFVDIMPEGPADDGIAYLNFYLEEDTETAPVLEKVRAVLEEVRGYMDIGEGTITESQTEDKDWINNWKEYFHQFYVDDILIVPSWEEVKEEDKDKMILHRYSFWNWYARDNPAGNSSAEEICDKRHPDAGCWNRKRYSWNCSFEAGRCSCCGN